MPPNLGGFFMVRSYYPSECHADYFDFERIEALKPAIEACGISTLSQSPMLGWFLNEWEAFKKVISRRNIRRRITIPLTLSNLKLLRRITRTENILHRNFTRRQVAIQN